MQTWKFTLHAERKHLEEVKDYRARHIRKRPQQPHSVFSPMRPAELEATDVVTHRQLPMGVIRSLTELRSIGQKWP